MVYKRKYILLIIIITRAVTLYRITQRTTGTSSITDKLLFINTHALKIYIVITN